MPHIHSCLAVYNHHEPQSPWGTRTSSYWSLWSLRDVAWHRGVQKVEDEGWSGKWEEHANVRHLVSSTCMQGASLQVYNFWCICIMHIFWQNRTLFERMCFMFDYVIYDISIIAWYPELPFCFIAWISICRFDFHLDLLGEINRSYSSSVSQSWVVSQPTLSIWAKVKCDTGIVIFDAISDGVQCKRFINWKNCCIHIHVLLVHLWLFIECLVMLWNALNFYNIYYLNMLLETTTSGFHILTRSNNICVVQKHEREPVISQSQISGSLRLNGATANYAEWLLFGRATAVWEPRTELSWWFFVNDVWIAKDTHAKDVDRFMHDSITHHKSPKQHSFVRSDVWNKRVEK